MQHAGSRRAFVGNWARLGHAVVIEHLRTRPEFFHELARGPDADAQLTGYGDFRHRRSTAGFGGRRRDLPKPQSVRGSAKERGLLVVVASLVARLAADAAFGNALTSQARSGLEGEPETDEWS